MNGILKAETQDEAIFIPYDKVESFFFSDGVYYVFSEGEKYIVNRDDIQRYRRYLRRKTRMCL